VRGQEVPITPEAINSLYWDEPIQSYSALSRRWRIKKISSNGIVNMLYVRALFPLFRPLDKTVQVDSVITLATKTDKDSPSMK
ncbi:hypothetical protein HAX54_028431, partial [Datura stramonium]|nr:hypothetical protein [Datura stramonium]